MFEVRFDIRNKIKDLKPKFLKEIDKFRIESYKIEDDYYLIIYQNKKYEKAYIAKESEFDKLNSIIVHIVAQFETLSVSYEDMELFLELEEDVDLFDYTINTYYIPDELDIYGDVILFLENKDKYALMSQDLMLISKNKNEIEKAYNDLIDELEEELHAIQEEFSEEKYSS